ncbi:amino acid permease [Clostridium sp. WLY-B-L2]|uniref:Amino acid permease n=1 Tax=Clostridium aromativorans TaxID=2836848 RepID=A0ABS8N1X3_9CLOT|nr:MULTISPECIES: amino acid permease [Clostridium]KAA8663127.1 amino acid permease [Clostridium sp. HV4-5-A1G]MCC9293798.1 amino acid permease [Clostridium aromativorans]CAB1241011.1 methylthioribose permease [Clostridiaceae bacterium BL-3]
MATNNSIFRTKELDKLLAETKGKKSLKKVLGPLELAMLGIGAIVGTGIFVLTGVAAANYAGPALILSFIFSGVTCCFAALCYSEMAAMIPVAGSAYTFGYVGLGEIWAWMIGWDLLMEYMVAVSAVAVGWSGYIVALFESGGIKLPAALVNPPANGGIINLPCILILLVIVLFLFRGMSQSAKLNDILVLIKLSVVILFIILGVGHIKPTNYHPFFPYGVSGVFKGAAVIFFAYIGFDAVSTAAEEVKNPQKDLPIGILGSLLVCTLLYILVSAVLTGVLPYYTYKTTAAPVAFALQKIGISWGSALVSIGAVCGLTSVLLVMTYGSTRILFSLSRDGLLPEVFSDVHPKFRTPIKSTMLVGVIVMLLSGFVSLGELATLTNIGTLIAFIIVSASVIVLRKTRPEYERPFRCPWVPFVPAVSIIFCAYLIWNLPHFTQMVCVIWLCIGAVIYFTYSRSHSLMSKEENVVSPTDGK